VTGGSESQAAGSHKHDGASARAKVAYHVCRIGIGLIFIIASLEKIAMPWEFGKAIYAYEILPGYLISPLGIAMPWVELTAGLLLVSNRIIRPAALLIGAMNIIFILAIASVMARGMEIDCGCGLEVGPMAIIVGTQADGWTLMRDIIFLYLSALVYFGAGMKK
jgi:putative oxidoreductase